MIASTPSVALSALLVVCPALPSGGGAQTRTFDASGQASVTFSDVQASAGASLGSINLQWGSTSIKKTGTSGIVDARVLVYEDIDRDGKYTQGVDVSLSDYSYEGPEVIQTSLTGGSATSTGNHDIRCAHTVELANGAVLANDSNLSQFR